MEQIQTNNILTEEAVIENEIKKFDKFDSRVAELRNQYSGLKIAGIEDKEGYESVRLALADLRAIRTGTEAERKEAKDLYIKVGKNIDSAAKKIIESVKAIEQPLQDQKDAIDVERDQIREEKRRKLDNQFATRAAILNRLGAAFDGEGYTLSFNGEEVSYKTANIREAEEDFWSEVMLPKFFSVYNCIAAQKEKEEQERKAEEEKQRKEREEFEKQRRELEQQQAELKRETELFNEAKLNQELAERRKKEREERELLERRGQQLLDIGLVRNTEAYVFKPTMAFVNDATILFHDEKGWLSLVEKLKWNIDEYNAEELIRIKKHQEEKDALLREKVLIEQRQRQAEEDAKKQEAIEAANDKGKWAMMLSEVNEVLSKYSFKSAKYRKMFTQLKENIELK